MKKIDVQDLNIVGERYESIDEFYKVNEERPLNEHYSTDYSSGKGSRRDVKGNKQYTWEETKRDMMLGSDLFDEDFSKALAEVEKEVPQSWKKGCRSRAQHDVIGQSVSVERAIVGHPKSFSRKKPVRMKQKTVTFFFSISCPWYTKTEERLKAGCILMAICEHMERMGYQTRILYSPDFSAGRKRGASDPEWPSQIVQFTLKDFKTRFNLKKMQFPLASESALFHVGCWWVHRAPMTTADWGSGEGYAVDNDDQRLKNAREYAKRHDAVYLSIPFIKNDCDMKLMKVYEYVMKELEAM